MMNTKKFGLYARVSSDAQESEKNIDSQIDSIEVYAKEKGLIIFKKYLDDGVSGVYLDRPGLDQLRDDAKAGIIEGAIFYSSDRLSRKYSYQVILLEEFEKLNFEIHFVTERKVENEEDRLAQGMRGLFADYERSKIIERTRRGRLFKIKQGNVMTSRPPYGLDYIRGQKEKGIHGYFKHNPKEIENAKKILKWSLKGISDRQIIRNLHELGIKPQKGADIWARSTIAKLLSTNLDVYQGFWHYNKYEQAIPKNRLKPSKYLTGKKTSRILRDKSDWIKVSLPDLAIITKEEAEKIRANRAKNKTLSPGNTKKVHLLQKMVYHAECNKMLYVDSKGDVSNYRCMERKNSLQLNPNACKGGQIKAEILDSVIWEDIKKLISNPKTVIAQAKKYIESQKTDDVLTGDFATISNKLAQLEIENQRLITAFREGVITMEDLRIQKIGLTNNENQLISQRNNLLSNRKTASSIDYKQLTNDIGQTIKDLKEVLGELKKEEKKQLLQWLQVKVVIGNHRYILEGTLPIVEQSKTDRFTQAQNRPFHRPITSTMVF